MTLAAWTLDSLTFGAAFALAAVCAALGLWRWGTNWTASGRDMTRAQRAETREQREVRRQLESLLARLEEFARDVDGRVNTACARLQGLLDEVDRRSGAVDSGVGRVGARERARSADFGARLARIRRKLRGLPEADERDVLQSKAPDMTDGSAAGDERIEAGAVNPHGPGESGVGDGRSVVTESACAAVEHRDPRFEHVYDLADRGLTVARVASETGLTLGEVELVLNLRYTA